MVLMSAGAVPVAASAVTVNERDDGVVVDQVRRQSLNE